MNIINKLYFGLNKIKKDEPLSLIKWLFYYIICIALGGFLICLLAASKIKIIGILFSVISFLLFFYAIAGIVFAILYFFGKIK